MPSCNTKMMRTKFPNKLHACQILSTLRLVRAPIFALRNVLAAGSFLIPFQDVGTCAVLPQYPHKCGLTRKYGYLGQYTLIITVFLTKTSIIPAFSTTNPQL